MCRLLGYGAARPETTGELLGDRQTAVFHDMAQLHDDGWGTAWVDRPADPVHAFRTPTSGFHDPALTRMLDGDPATARIIHLRLASDGIGCTAANTHPFAADGLAFAHNGGLFPVEGISPFLDPDVAATITGTTDSERYFGVIRSRLRESGDPVAAVVAAVRQLRPSFPHASLNALVLSPTHLIAVHASEFSAVPHQMLDASGLPEHLMPAEHRTAFYLMRMLRGRDGSVAFASSGLDIAGWEPLPPETVAAVDLVSHELSFHEIGVGAPETAGITVAL